MKVVNVLLNVFFWTGTTAAVLINILGLYLLLYFIGVHWFMKLFY